MSRMSPLTLNAGLVRLAAAAQVLVMPLLFRVDGFHGAASATWPTSTGHAQHARACAACEGGAMGEPGNVARVLWHIWKTTRDLGGHGKHAGRLATEITQLRNFEPAGCPAQPSPLQHAQHPGLHSTHMPAPRQINSTPYCMHRLRAPCRALPVRCCCATRRGWRSSSAPPRGRPCRGPLPTGASGS